MRYCIRLIHTAILALFAFSSAAADPPTTARVRELFAHPTRAYSTGPLWVWNDLLTEAEIRDTLHDLAAQKVKQVWVHPRPGLMTPYLSPAWFQLWKVTLAEAHRLDLNVWIYDENSYPSGFAGGLVPEAMPESRGRGLNLREVKQAPEWNATTVGVYRLTGVAFENVSRQVQSGTPQPEGNYLVATEERARNTPWNGGKSYVNLLSPGVTEKFLELTLEPYRRELGAEFGKRIPGVFTDEPNIRPAGGLPWSEILEQEFQKRWNFSLIENLPSLAREIGDWRKIRHNYFQVLNEQFIAHWARPYHDYCASNHLEWTGHYWDHEWPHCAGVPDNMAMYAWHQRPAIDCLMNQFREDTHGQFGNLRMVHEVTSVANQLGKPRTLCETYGAGGWDLRFEDMKRIGDWLSVLGINTINQHLSYVTIRGARKRDHPQSFSYHEPWWEAYHISADYFARLSAALSQGEQINRILVLEPTTTAWMYQGNDARLTELGNNFFAFLKALDVAQIEYDLGSEDVLQRHGVRDGSRNLTLGQRTYSLVVLPPGMENLNATTKQLLDGKTQLAFAEPKRLDGKLAPASDRNAPQAGTEAPLSPDAMQDFVRRIHESPAAFGFDLQSIGSGGILFHQRRQLADGQLLFLVNSSLDQPARGRFTLPPNQIPEQWDLATGRVLAYPLIKRPDLNQVQFELPPSGSLLLWLGRGTAEVLATHESVNVIKPQGLPTISRIAPNVLTLDYLDLSVAGETHTNLYFYEANRLAFKRHGLEANPWDSAVQFGDELIRKTFPAASGFVASYKFNIASQVPKNLEFVLERPDLYQIQCNGKSVRPRAGKWWLDRAFGRISINHESHVGENVVTISARPFSMYHEIEPAYVIGDFRLQPAEHGFVIAPDAPLALQASESKPGLTHGINPEGTMWLTSGIGFSGASDDRAPFVVFDLGKTVDLKAIRIWNYCESHVTDLTGRGAKEIRLSAAADSSQPDFNQSLGTITLRRASSHGGSPEDFAVNVKIARWVRLEILSNYHGTKYPATGTPEDNGFVGLAEVQFLAGGDRPIPGVKVRTASSELPTHGRLAKYLVDGSGLGAAVAGGWNAQGHPFYSAGVSYRETFNLAERHGHYSIALPKWLGSVARVNVNGHPAGYIDCPPWKLDITRLLRTGKNTVEVTVIGTLKNTLGPHHGNPALGAAWPSAFHVGPKNGPPPGDSYSTVGYGLFAPFDLEQMTSSAD